VLAAINGSALMALGRVGSIVIDMVALPSTVASPAVAE
jgi:hypothetical protein